jgi:hypothetical protein
MAREDINQFLVIDHGRLEGFVSRWQILRLLQIAHRAWRVILLRHPALAKARDEFRHVAREL